jgi:hypothetical protein
MGMTKEEFLEGVRELAADFKDPNGAFAQLLVELEDDEIMEAGRHDPELGRHFAAVASAIRYLGAYAVARVS